VFSAPALPLSSQVIRHRMQTNSPPHLTDHLFLFSNVPFCFPFFALTRPCSGNPISLPLKDRIVFLFFYFVPSLVIFFSNDYYFALPLDLDSLHSIIPSFFFFESLVIGSQSFLPIVIFSDHDSVCPKWGNFPPDSQELSLSVPLYSFANEILFLTSRDSVSLLLVEEKTQLQISTWVSPIKGGSLDVF